MSRAKKLIDGLEQLVENERGIAELYNRAADVADTNGNKGAAGIFRRLQESHADHALVLSKRRDELEKEQGEGMLAEVLESFEEALSSVVAGLPVDFIRGEVEPAPATLVAHEETLIRHYENLAGNTDDETGKLLRSFTQNYRANIKSLLEL